MPRIIWSPEALLDVQRLYRFIAPKNLGAAKRAVKSIRESVKVLATQPGLGRLVDDLHHDFREWIVDFGDSGYVVRYHLN
jgi:plasmid stabilization system protein ParE